MREVGGWRSECEVVVLVATDAESTLRLHHFVPDVKLYLAFKFYSL
jgi:hypothetical protein